MNNFEKFEEQLLSKEKFYSLLTGKKIVTKNMTKNMNMFLKVVSATFLRVCFLNVKDSKASKVLFVLKKFKF